MLAEIRDVRQIPGEGFRRWFSDGDFDLIVWYAGGEIAGFQLCYDKGRRERALKLLYPKVAPVADVQVTKTLRVVLSNRETFVAEVKAYSPPLAATPGKQASSRGTPTEESGKDVAILKIDARNLPTIVLGDSDRVELGQPLQMPGDRFPSRST
jgi:hypothetical protein